MKIQLPLENWADLLPFVPRRQLAALLLFQLDDRQFASILQYCLNEVGQITLGHLHVLAPRQIGELCQMLGWYIVAMAPMPETTMPDKPIPKNVQHFKSLTLSYFDSSVLDFLQKFHQHKNALLANVNLSIRDCLPIEMVQPILAQILPLIGDNIKSLQIYDHDLERYNRKRIVNNDELLELMAKMLAQTRILSIGECSCSYMEFDYCGWLCSPRTDGQPKMLNISLMDDDGLHFIGLIKRKFLMAKHPVTFFIRLQPRHSWNLETICLENGETNENLLVVKKWHTAFLISRLPMAAKANGAKWIQANEQELSEFEHDYHERTIYLDIES